MKTATTANFTATRNACKLCAPLGACLAYRGIEGTVPYLHGGQGCATYIRRYMISHYREPVDIASSSFDESAAIFGGSRNFAAGLDNVIRQYEPKLVGVATTCLSETIGDDMRLFLHEYRSARTDRDLPPIVAASTPSYSGTHADGFHAAVRAVTEKLARPGSGGKHVNLLPGIVSSADLRHLRRLVEAFDLPCTILPDYSDTLDGGTWDVYHRIPQGGTPLGALAATGSARASLQLSAIFPAGATAGGWLAEQCGVPCHTLGLPVGVRATDRFLDTLAELSGREIPPTLIAERARLIDAYVDAHKHLAGARAIVFGEEDLAAALAGMLAECGAKVLLCVSGGRSGRLEEAVGRAIGPDAEMPDVRSGTDFAAMEELARDLEPNLLVGNSKGYTMSRNLGVPLVRTGFPVHDRVGGSRLGHVGYRGTQQLFDRIANALIAARQDASPVGYTYM